MELEKLPATLKGFIALDRQRHWTQESIYYM